MDYGSSYGGVVSALFILAEGPPSHDVNLTFVRKQIVLELKRWPTNIREAGLMSLMCYLKIAMFDVEYTSCSTY